MAGRTTACGFFPQTRTAARLARERCSRWAVAPGIATRTPGGRSRRRVMATPGSKDHRTKNGRTLIPMSMRPFFGAYLFLLRLLPARDSTKSAAQRHCRAAFAPGVWDGLQCNHRTKSGRMLIPRACGLASGGRHAPGPKAYLTAGGRQIVAANKKKTAQPHRCAVHG